MGTHEFTESASAPSRVVSRGGALLTWLGGGHRRELGERHERSAHAVAGAVVVLGAVSAWIVASLAVSEAVRWSLLAVLPLTGVFGLLVGAVTRGTAAGPNRGRAGTAGRAAVALAVGVVVGDLAALVVLSSAIDHRLDDEALRAADSAPAVAQASVALQQSKDARAALDRAVDRAREDQDKALVVARCEYNPTPGCPQTRITGVPGPGPETRSANELLADAQRDLDNALATRDRQAPELDSRIAREQQSVSAARRGVIAESRRGLGARWVAMNGLTFAGVAALSLRLAVIASCALLYLLPLILGLWRGQTTHERQAKARAERERAELDADTAIAVKRAEVRREAEILWAEHQLTQARLAIEAQLEIDREEQRRRVQEALESPVHASSRRGYGSIEEPIEESIEEPMEEDMYLPIAAEAEAASRAIAQRPTGPAEPPEAPANLPAPVESAAELEPHEERPTRLIPSLPDATKAAARWIRPLVPPVVARVIDTTTQPLRTARQVFEEVEEITFSLKRTRKVTVDSESSDLPPRKRETGESPRPAPPPGRVASWRGEPSHPGYHDASAAYGYASVEELPPGSAVGRSLGPAGRADERGRLELVEREGPRRLSAPEGPRQLPPGE